MTKLTQATKRRNLDRVKAAVDGKPRTTREIFDRVGHGTKMSVGFHLRTLLQMGEIERSAPYDPRHHPTDRPTRWWKT